jgi:hypothetical protein
VAQILLEGLCLDAIGAAVTAGLFDNDNLIIDKLRPVRERLAMDSGRPEESSDP